MATADDLLDTTSAGLSDFRRYAKDFTSLSAWMGKLFVVIPLADFATQVGPNWPNFWLGKVVGSIACGFGLMFCFLLYDWKNLSQRKYVFRMAAAMLFMACLAVAYITLYSIFVVSITDQGTVVTTGFTNLPQIDEFIDLSPNHQSAKDLLEKFHEPESIWTIRSLTSVRISLLCLWVAGWGAFAIAVGVFIIAQWKKERS